MSLEILPRRGRDRMTEVCGLNQPTKLIDPLPLVTSQKAVATINDPAAVRRQIAEDARDAQSSIFLKLDVALTAIKRRVYKRRNQWEAAQRKRRMPHSSTAGRVVV